MQRSPAKDHRFGSMDHFAMSAERQDSVEGICTKQDLWTIVSKHVQVSKL